MKDIMQKILDTQAVALIRRASEGHILTASELKQVEKYVAKKFPKVESALSPDGEAPDGEALDAALSSVDDIAPSASELARRLGLHRQVISSHRKRADAPDDLSVSKWRAYLTAHGKMPTLLKIESGSQTDAANGKPRHQHDEDTAFAILFDAISNNLEVAVAVALENAKVKAKKRQRDSVTFGVWMLLATVYQDIAPRYDASGPFDAVTDDGKPEYPEAIKALTARIAAKLPKDASPA